jgi:hypothetical protein
MKAQHTPGPWETAVNDEGQWDVCDAGGGDLLADLSDCPENAEANARLIAAAPELLAALKAILARVESGEGMGGKFLGGPPLPIREARAAIARATGGAQ